MTSGFSHLSVSGYRRLRDLHMELRPFNVLIGANGIGKSSFLDVIDLLAASAEGKLQTTITELGGMASLMTADGKTNSLTLTLRMDQLAAAPLDYQLRLSSETVGYVISSEAMTQQRDPSATAPFKYIDAAGSVRSISASGVCRFRRTDLGLCHARNRLVASAKDIS